MNGYWVSSRTLICISILALISHPYLSGAYEVVYAVNCGGGKHTDRFGIHYSADDSRVGVSSEFGKTLIISRVHPDDMILYQTERYHTSSFAYDILVPDDGQYFLIVKFAEVYFQMPNQKVFDIVLNGQHVVVPRLDIFAKVGKAAAHDEVIPFSIDSGQLHVMGESSDFDGSLSVEFAKGPADNPKVNAIVVVKGPLENTEIPALPPLERNPESSEQGEPDSEWTDSAKEQKFKRTSGPRVQDPYASDDSWFMPITIAVALFLPILFCLCRVR